MTDDSLDDSHDDTHDGDPGTGGGPQSDTDPQSGDGPETGDGPESVEALHPGVDSESGGGPESDDGHSPGSDLDWDPDDGPFGPFRNRLERIGVWFVAAIAVGILLAVGSGGTILSLDTTDYVITYVLLPYAAVLAALWVIDAVSAWRDR